MWRLWSGKGDRWGRHGNCVDFGGLLTRISESGKFGLVYLRQKFYDKCEEGVIPKRLSRNGMKETNP